MYEDTNRRRPRLEDAKMTNNSAPKSGFFFTGFQMAVCVICLVLALALKQFGGGYYKAAKVYVKDALQNSITSEEVTDVLHNIGKQLPDAAEVFSSGVTSSASAKNDTQSSAASGAAASSSASSSKSSTSSTSKSSSAASTTSEATIPAQSVTKSSLITTTVKTVKSVDCSFTGAEHMPVIDTSILASKSQLPPATASFAPFRLSMLPVKPVSGRITSAFGYRVNPITGKYNFHSGMDIAAAGGTPIAAAFAGKVEEVGKSDFYGNYVILDSGGGVKTFYGHCETISAKQGEKVKAGDIIAKVGSTGMSTGYHLHFEMRVNNICENPQWVI